MFVRLSVSVTPHVGVWIETVQSAMDNMPTDVTPHVGVWIETRTSVQLFLSALSHTSCRCVD